jgi:hypothetical protein
VCARKVQCVSFILSRGKRRRFLIARLLQAKPLAATARTVPMTTRLTIFILILWGSASGQSSILGDWKSYSIGLTNDINKETKIQDRYDKVVFSFYPDGSYRKLYFIPRDTKEIPLYKNYEVKNDKLVKKQILTQDGAALKMLVVKEKMETGKFKLNAQADTVSS